MSEVFIDELFNRVFEQTASTGLPSDRRSSNVVPVLTTLSLSRLQRFHSHQTKMNELPASQLPYSKIELLLQHDTSREEAVSLLLEFPMLSKKSYQVHSHVDTITNKRRRVCVESPTPGLISSHSDESAVIPPVQRLFRPFIPFDASDRWKCLQRFYANQKMNAWDDGMIPRLASNPNPCLKTQLIPGELQKLTPN